MDFTVLTLPPEKQYLLQACTKHQEKVKNENESRITLWRENRFFPGFSADTVRYIYEEWNGVRQDDVFIVAFPKSGTHWLAGTINSMFAINDNQSTNIPETFASSIFIEEGPVEHMEILDWLPLRRRILISHSSADTFNVEKAKNGGAKIIYLIRNPKDLAVSWFNFARKIPVSGKLRTQLTEPWDNFLRAFMSGEHPLFTKDGEGHLDHVLSWWKYKNDEDVLFIYYEDLKLNFKETVKSISNFLNEYVANEDIANIEKKCSIEKMKQDWKKNYHGSEDSAIYRKGIIGDWKNYFTVLQSEAMDQLVEQKLVKDNDIKFVYET